REAMLASGSVPVNGVVLTLLVLVTSIALVAGLAWASRRLLGLPVGALRALIAGLLGFAAAELLVRTLQPVQSGHVAVFLTVVLGPEPAAAASIAQVHKARLRCGDRPDAEVAVKVQRPGIRSTVEQDLDILLRLADTLEDRARWARAVGTAGVARGFAAALREELDFRVEARNMAAVAATWPDQRRAVGGSV